MGSWALAECCTSWLVLIFFLTIIPKGATLVAVEELEEENPDWSEPSEDEEAHEVREDGR